MKMKTLRGKTEATINYKSLFFIHPESSVQISALKLKAWIVDAKEAWDLFKQTDRASSTILKAYLCSSLVAAFASHLPFPASLLSLRTKIRTLKDRVLRHRASLPRTVTVPSAQGSSA
jgi:hypothetical protein